MESSAHRVLLLERSSIVALALLATTLAGCGSGPSRAVRECVHRWNGSITKDVFQAIPTRTEANVAVVRGHCVVTLMEPHRRALVFRRGDPGDGVGGFLFMGSSEPEKLPGWQQDPNASVGPRFALTLTE